MLGKRLDAIAYEYRNQHDFGEKYRKFQQWKTQNRTPENFDEYLRMVAVYEFVELHAESLDKDEFIQVLDNIVESYE